MTTLGATVSTTTFPSGSSSAYELDTTATVGGSGATNLTAIAADLATLTAAGGGTLKFLRGTYDFGVSGSTSILVAVPANCRILGAGKDVTILKSASTQAGHVLFGITSVANVQIQGVTIDGASAVAASFGVNTTTATYCTVKDVRITADFGWGIFLGSNTQQCAILDCVIDGSNGSHGVEINGSSYNTVNGCVFKAGGTAPQQAIEIYDASANRCTGNKITNNTIMAAGYSGIVAVGDINTVIANNVINACGITGITLTVSAFDASRYSTGVTVIGNTINGANVSDVGAQGINCDKTLDCVLSGNTITNTVGAGDGIFVNNGTGGMIVGNVSSSNGGNGINLNDNATRIVIVGNQCNNNSGTGVGSKHGLACTGTYNTVIGNTSNDNRGGSNRQGYGFIISGANNTVIGNKGTGNVYAGVYVNGATCQTFANDETNTPTALQGYFGAYGTAPIAKPTGVAVTAAGIHAALVSLGLIAA